MTTTVVLIVGSAVSDLSDSVAMLVVGCFVTGFAMSVSGSIIPRDPRHGEVPGHERHTPR